MLFSINVHGGPDGGNVVGGVGSISHSGNTTTINQNTDLMAIDWGSYNVNADERVHYVQPDSSSVSLNRILSNHGSQIHGSIDANGQVILVNPNGIVFGENATINVGGILASGLDINPNDFMNGNFTFSAIEGAEGRIINSGLINAATGGSVSLLGKHVENNGLITANLGAVNLSAGKEAVVTFDNPGLMGVRVTKEILQNELGVDPAVINSGEITAESGRILLSGSVSEDIFTRAVNIENRATSVVVHDDGSFTLGGGADVVNSGTINASAVGLRNNAGQIVMLGENVTSSGELRAEGAGGDIELHSVTTTMLVGDSVTSTNAMDGGKAGDIKILGRNVGAVDKSIVAATGLNGGGEVLIGGDETGANKLIRNAQFIYLGQDTNVFSDATGDGNGGRVITFANDTARVYGGLFARGGEISGDGGFIETSGLVGLDITSIPNAAARSFQGKSGEWLIDPYDVEIVDGLIGSLPVDNGQASFESSLNNTRIGVGRITAALRSGSGTNVTIKTGEDGTNDGGNITVSYPIELLSNFTANSALTLIAHNDIYLNGNIRAQNVDGTLGIDLQAGGDIELGSGYDLLSNGAPISFIGDNFTMERGGSGDLNTTIWSSGGTVDLNFTGHISIDTGEAANADSRARILTDGGALTISANTFSIGNSANNSSYLDTGGGALHITAEQINLGGFIVPASTPAATPIHEVTAILDSTNNTSAGSINLTGAINLIGDVAVDAASDGVDGDVTFAGDVTGNSQNLNINGGIIDIDDVDISGADDQDGGELDITGTGSVTTGHINTSGGFSSGNGDGTSGRNGGDVDIRGSSITVSGIINSSGSSANDSDDNGVPQFDGGAGGVVELESFEGSITVGGIQTDGGSGDAQGGGGPDDASGGDAGDITITSNGGSGQLYLGGNLLARGGRLHEEIDNPPYADNDSNDNPEVIENGASGNIQLNAQDVVITSNVTIDTTLVPVVLNDPDDPGSGNASSAIVDAVPTELTFNGTIDGTDSGGQSLSINAGNVTFNEAIGSNTRLGAFVINATGALNATGRNINATSFSSVSTTFDSSDINTAGDINMAGGNITVDASGQVNIGNITTEAGVRSADGDGYSGGNVELAGSAITVGEINTNGGAARAGAGVNDGGNAGTINLTSQENAGEYSITLLGDVSAIGGAGENGGVEGSSQTANLDLVSGDGYGHVTLSPTQSAGSLLTGFFSSNINITANVGEGVSTLTGPAFFDETLYWNIAGDGAGTIDAAGDVPLDPVSTRVQFNGFSILNGSNASEVFRIGDNSYTLTITAADGSISEVVGPDSINIWDISDGGTTIRTAGQIGEPTISLFGFSRYTGNDQADTFDVNYGTFNGVLDGGEGSDRLVVWDNAGALVLVGSNTPGGAWINTLNVEHIEAQENTNSTLMVNGNGNSVWRLLADDVDGNTTLDGQNDGELQYNLVMDEDTDPPIATSTISFFNFSSLNGNAGNDDFLIEDSAIFTGSINGDFFSSGEGRDTLQSNNSPGSNEWSISSLMAGTLLYGPGGSQNQITFSNMHALTGGTATDTLRVIDDLASESGTWTVNASAPDTLSLTSDLDTKLEFDGIERLIGGSENDTFNIGDSIEYIDGGLGGDQFYVMAASIEVELVGGPQTGDSGHDVLVSHQGSSNFWTLDGPNSGSVNTGDAYDPIALVTFSWMEELQGASELDDVFEFTTPDQTAMEILGGEDGGIDTVRYGFTDQPVTLVIAADGSDSTGVQGIENIVGNSFHESGVGTSTLMVTNAGPTFWEINAINGGEVEVGGEIVTFSNFPGLIGGAGDDQFTVTSGSITVIDGGSDGTDSIIGRAVDSEFNLGNNTDPHSGSVIALETAMPYVAEFSNIDSFTGNGDNDRLNATELDFNLTVDLGGNTGTLTLTGIETIDANVGNDNTLIGRNSSSTWSINPGAHTLSDSSGTIAFSNFDNLVSVDGAGDTFDINDALTSVTGGNGADTFNIAASIATVYGGMGNDQFRLNTNALATMLDGQGGTDSLTGFTTTSTWVVNSSGSTSSISTGGVTTNFTGMENLNGRNDVADTFTLNSFGSATGLNINAGGGETQDIVDYSDIDTALIIDIDSGNAFNGVGGAELLQGNSNHTLMASAGAAWRIYDFDGDGEDIADGANDGEVNGTQFVDFGNLRGGSGIDNFVFDGGTLSGNITGADNNDTISRTVEGTTWEITGNDQGTFDDLDGIFSGISTLEGNAGADTFIFHSGSSWSGTIIGGEGAGEDIVESRHSASNIWNITGAGSGNISWLNEGGSDGFTGIETIEGSDSSDTFNLRTGGSINRITGGSGSQDFIVALNEVANKWNITGDDAGNITNSDGSTTFVANFTGIENLTGNDADDYFDVSLNANISGIIDGGETDNDTLDLEDYGPAVVNLDGEGVDGFSTQNIEVFHVDGNENNELSGGNIARDWYIIGENSVRINERTYNGFSSLTGGNRNDNFIFQTGGSLTGRISGGEGGGTDSITGPNETITWSIDNNESGSIDSILPDGFFQIEEIQGGDGQDVFHIGANVSRIMGGNGGDTFHVNENFSGILNGEEGDDIFILAAAVNLEVFGGTGADTFNVSYYDSDLSLSGGADSDNDILTLAHSQAAEWELNGGEEEVTVGSASVFFSDIQIINGSMGADTFDVTGDFDGAVNGRDGDDIFNLYASIVDGASGGAGENIFNILSTSVIAILTGGDDVDTLAVGHGGDVEWDISPTSGIITNQNGSPGQITFSGMENGEGSTGSDIFNLSASFNRLEGNTGVDVFNIEASTVSATLVGSSDFTTLNINHGAESSWQLNGGEEQVSNDDGMIRFSGMGELNGGSGTDTFDISETIIASSISGRGGEDIFNLSAAVSASLNGGDGNDIFNINNGMYSYVINGEGGDGDTLNIEYADNNQWIFDDDGFTVQADGASEATEFQLIEVINGGAGIDNVDFYTNYAGVIDGRGNGDTYTLINAGIQTEINDSGATGNDSLIVAHGLDTTWMIVGDGSSVTDDSAGSAVFSGMEMATGGNGADSFTINSPLLQVNGRGGGDQFLLSAEVTNGVFGGDGNDTFTLLAEGLSLLINGGNDNDTLVGADSTETNQWHITGANEGTLTNGTTIDFLEIENLTGGEGNDSYTFVSTGGNTGSLDGVIDGGDHIEGDSIDAVQLGGGLTVSMGDEISDINFVAIERIEVAEAQPGASGDFNEFIGNDSLNFWTFDGRNTGTLEDVDAGTLTRFIGFQNITGGDGADTFTLEGSSAGVDGTIDGAGQPADSFDSVDFSGIPVAHTVLIGNGVNGITGVEGFTGYRPGTVGEGQDRTLVGLNYNGNIWTISDFDGDDVLADGVNDGRYQEGLSGDPVSFANFNRLVGGSGDDTFTFYDNATISGEIHGGDGGRNVIDADSQATPTSGRDLTAQINGDIEGILNLQNIQSVTGNDGNTNTLIAGNVGASHTWTIDDDNSGNINGIEFANFVNLTGSDTIADRFEFHGTATVSGLIEGGSRAGDTVDLTDLNRDFDIIVQIGDIVNDYLNVNNVENINANPINNNQLIAANRANTWNINGENEGNIDHTGNVLPETSIAFDGFENLTGGSDSDLFILDGTDNVTGLIDGGAGEAGDELRLTGLTRDITVVLDSRVGDVQSELNAIQFETISANGANVNTLVAGNDPNLAASTNNTWEIDAENEGRLNNIIDFIEFDNLVGGDTNDTFEFSLLGAITGYIDGGDESTEDVVDMSLLSAVSVTLGDGTNSLRDIERIVGNNRNSTLTADNIINEWNLASGINDGTLNGLVFTDFNQLVGGSERDTFTINGGAVTGNIDGAGGNDVVNLTLPELATGELAFIGGDQNDTLIISGGNDNYSATYSPDVAGESRLVYSDPALNSYTVRYTTTETIQDNVVANSLTINGSANAETITLANNNVVVGQFAQVNYDNKNNIVLAGAADDTVTIDGVVNVPGQLAIRNATVAANDDALVVANSVLFNATGQVGSAGESLILDTGNILVRSTNGDVYLENRDSVNIVELSTASRFDLVAAGQVSSNAALSSQGAVSITANNGNIELTNTSNAFQGPLTLNAANNNITLVNNSATDLAGIVSQTLSVTSGGAIVGSGQLLVNGLATFDSVADVTLDNNNNDFSSVSVLNANDVVLVDRNQLTLANFDGVDTLTTQSNGLVVNGVIQSANVAINAQSGTANLNNAINSTGAVSIEANGIAANDTINAGSILLSDSAGGVNLTGVLRTNGGEIRINSDGSSVTQQGRISTSGGAITLNAANDIVMTGSAISESADGLISYSAGGNIDLTRIAAGEGTIAINSAGSVYDTQEGSADIIANRLEISSRTGISGTQIQSDFETDISELFVINNGGEVRISNAGTVRVDRLRSNGDVTLTNETGDIIFNNQPDNTYMRDETDALLAGGVSNANYDQGFIAITSNQGSILALGSADSSQPDIVGRGARLLAIRGEVGAGNRPLVLHVRDNLFIHGFRSLTPFWSFGTEPLDFNDASTIKVDLLDLINLSGEQLVEVEELEEVNPAIFTAVTNYFYDDVSIRLPNDQLYEDELEELTALD